MQHRQAYERCLATRRFEALDGFRALAILAVIGHHVAGGRQNPVLDRALGSSTFFAISGFLITALLLRERRETGTIAVARFYVRRSLRILPLYYAALGLYVALVVLFERGTPAGARFLSSLPAFATLTSNWFVTSGESHSIFYFAWSMAAQEQFYLLWPLLIVHARPRWAPPVVMALLAAAGEAGRWALAAGAAPPAAGLRILAGVPGPICLGSVAAYILDDERGFEAASVVLGRSWSVPLWLGVLAIPSVFRFGHAGAALTCASVILLVVACVLHPWPPLQAVLESRLARFVGMVSYGMYLLHMLALNAARRLLPGRGPTLLFAATVVLSVAVAAASRSFFEKPVADEGRRRFLAGRCSRPPLEAGVPGEPAVTDAARRA